MARLKIADIVAKSEDELAGFVGEQRRKLAQLNIDSRTKKLSNVKEMATIKRSIAQALTIQREREITRLENSNG
jgi:ribosomal protein L29